MLYGENGGSRTPRTGRLPLVVAERAATGASVAALRMLTSSCCLARSSSWWAASRSACSCRSTGVPLGSPGVTPPGSMSGRGASGDRGTALLTLFVCRRADGSDDVSRRGKDYADRVSLPHLLNCGLLARRVLSLTYSGGNSQRLGPEAAIAAVSIATPVVCM